MQSSLMSHFPWTLSTRLKHLILLTPKTQNVCHSTDFSVKYTRKHSTVMAVSWHWTASLSANSCLAKFYVPLTVRLSIIFVNNQLDTQFSSLIQTCKLNGNLYKVTYNRCRIDTINSLDDGHMAARNMMRKQININEKELCVKLVIYKVCLANSWKFTDGCTFQRSVCIALIMWINIYFYMSPWSLVDNYWRWEKRTSTNKMEEIGSSNV
jgi:hypothetical protein